MELQNHRNHRHTHNLVTMWKKPFYDNLVWGEEKAITVVYQMRKFAQMWQQMCTIGDGNDKFFAIINKNSLLPLLREIQEIELASHEVANVEYFYNI